MRFIRQTRFVLVFAAIVFISGVMVVWQMADNFSRHTELREAFIFMYSRGNIAESQRLYTELLLKVPKQPFATLVQDYDRTVPLAPTNQSASTNILVRYRLSLQKEMERRLTEKYLQNRIQDLGNE